MIKKLSLSFIIVLISTIIFASTVPFNTAKTVATNWYKHYAPSAVTDYAVKDFVETKNNRGLTTFYTFVFNVGDFVMVPADNDVTPIIGYSFEGTFDKNNIPPNAQNFFDSYSKEIAAIVSDNKRNSVTLTEWNDLLSETFSRAPQALIPASPLCATTWDQTTGYNTYCPGGTPTGCVATAMAQVMKKWNYPTTGAGTHTYTPAGYAAQTANFGATTYNWAAMPLTSGNTSVATLMYHLGVSVDMQYAPSGSGAYNTAVPPAFINYFKYQPSAEAKYKSSFSTEALWQTLIKAEIDAGRPCMLGGSSTASGGHEFVCDQYNNSTWKFHINWGWGGASNGVFLLSALNPSGSNFSSDRQAVIRIQPLSAIIPIANFTASTNIPAIAAPVNFTDQSINNPTSWLWTFEGGTPSTSTAQNPTGITFATNGYHVVSLKAVNANGSDIKTKERYIKVGGAATVWTKQNSSFTAGSRGVDEIEIVDANTVWAKAYDGSNPTGYIREITRTNDGGATWTPGTITFANSINYGVANIWPLSYTTAYACMFPITGTGGAIVKTTDGGTTWAIQSTAPFTTSWADFVHFFDANNGVCMGDPIATTAGSDFVIYTTTNGGTTWTQVPIASLPNSLANEAGITNLYTYVGNTIWFSTSKGRVFKSIDKGLTWTVSNTGFTGAFNTTFTMRFKDASTGFAVLDTLPYTVKKTINGGTTWTTVTPTGYFVKRPQLAFVPGSASTWFDVAVAPSNGSSKSTDDCVSFVNVDTGSVQFTSVAFFDVNTGWAGSYNISSTDGGIYKWNSTPPIVASATQTNVTCNGGTTGSATVTATGGTPPLTYSWSPSGGTAATATGLAAGTYICTITGGTAVSTQTVTITQPSALVASIPSSTNVSCFLGNNGSATVSATGGTGTATYSWSPSGGSSATATGLVSGTYIVTATDANGCSTSTNTTITEPSALLGSVTAQTNILCNGAGTGSVDVIGTSGTAGYTYSLDGGTYQAGSTFNGLTAAAYSITVKDANGCTVNVPVTITQPTALAGTITSQTNVLCNGSNTGSVDVAGSNGTPGYTYSLDGGTAQANGTLSGLDAISHTVTVIDSNGCTVDIPVTITQPSQVTVTATNVDATCGVSNGALTASGANGSPGYSYSIDGVNFQASGAFSNLASGVYSVTVKDANGCTNSSSATINNQNGPSSSVSAQTNVLCNGAGTGSLDVIGSNGTPGYTYSLNGGANQVSGTFNSLTAGSYTVMVTDANGCTGITNASITEPSVLTAITSSTPETVAGNGTASVIASGGTTPYSSYLWDDANAQTTQTATGLIGGTYSVTVTDANGCAAVQTVVVNSTVGIASMDYQSSVKVYPNPGNGNISVEINTESNKHYTLKIMNSIGQLIYNQSIELNAGKNLLPISLDANCEGLYIVQVVSNEGVVNIPLVKSKQ